MMPGVDRECTPHHHACDCREAMMLRFQDRIAELEAEVRVREMHIKVTAQLRAEGARLTEELGEAVSHYKNLEREFDRVIDVARACPSCGAAIGTVFINNYCRDSTQDETPRDRWLKRLEEK